MEKPHLATALVLLCLGACPAGAQSTASSPTASPAATPATPEEHFRVEEHASEGSVSIGGRRIDYEAIAGNLVVHPKGWDDVAQNADKEHPSAEASMFYVAYFAKGEKPGRRPVTFFYNGGPGSSSVWLHMGAFGPRRVVTADDSHTPAAPYAIVNNEYSLLDASDLVFIDAPGTGLSRIAGKEREKAFYGIDADASAFTDFICQFLSRHERWNSPRFLFGESYGTTRNAVVVNELQSDRMVDMNGMINLSQALVWELLPGLESGNPAVEEVYALSLPSYAATAWYHHALPADAPRELPALLREVEAFASGEYIAALQAGGRLDAATRGAIAGRLHRYTGLPLDLIEKADLRISAGVFEKHLLEASDRTVGRLDSRFSGPTLDTLSKEAEYDPQASSIGPAYVAAINQYLRADLKFNPQRAYLPEINIESKWDFRHRPPGGDAALTITPNVLGDLASAMKQNPNLKVMFNGGYYDLATTYFAMMYERDHLPIPAEQRARIETSFYESGHMVYAHEAAHRQLHERVADFIRRASARPEADGR